MHTTIKSSLSALCFAGFALAGGMASAASVSSPTAAIVFVDGTKNFGASFASGNATATFTDDYTFTLDSGSKLNSLTSSISDSAAVGLTITGFYLTSSSGYYQAGVQDSTGVVDLWQLVTTKLGAGDYTLTVAGVINSAESASYGGNLNVAVSAVPEPASYGLLLGGLGLLGVMARRRKQGGNNA